MPHKKKIKVDQDDLFTVGFLGPILGVGVVQEKYRKVSPTNFKQLGMLAFWTVVAVVGTLFVLYLFSLVH